MPSISIPALENETAKRVVTALAAGATTYIKPARFPKWVRRGVSMSNTLASVGMAVVGDRKPESTRLSDSASSDIVEVANGVTVSRASANWAAAASAGMALVTSGIAMRVDARVEKSLLKRGISHPRLVMAVGAAALSLATPWISKQIEKSTARLQEKALPKETLRSTLADPLGKQRTGAGATSQLGPGVREAARPAKESDQDTASHDDAQH